MFYEQLQKACKERGTSITAVLKKIGIGTANGTYWKNGSVPSSDIVIQLSEFLNVSTDYLLKGEENIENSIEITDNDLKFALFDGVDDITDEMFDEVKQFAQMVKMREDAKRKETK